VVRLPKGVFSPYSNIATNIFFINNPGPTKVTWYYQIPKRKEKNYSKSRPIKFEEFDDCISWFKDKKRSKLAWKVSIEELKKDNYNLDRHHPDSIDELEYQDPELLFEEIIEKQKQMQGTMKALHTLLKG